MSQDCTSTRAPAFFDFGFLASLMLRSLDGEPTFLTSPGVSSAVLARKKAAPRQLAGQGASLAASRLASGRFWRSCGTVARACEEAFHPGKQFFLLRAPAAASRLEGSGGSADFCGVFGEYLSRDGFIWSSCGRGAVWMVSTLLRAAEADVQFAANGGVREARFTRGKIKLLQLLLCRCAACGNVTKLWCVCSDSAMTADAAGWAASNGLKCVCASPAGTLGWALHPHDH